MPWFRAASCASSMLMPEVSSARSASPASVGGVPMACPLSPRVSAVRPYLRPSGQPRARAARRSVVDGDERPAAVWRHAALDLHGRMLAGGLGGDAGVADAVQAEGARAIAQPA